MNLAILTDIHSNKFALSSSLNFLNYEKIDKYIFLGDFFGYYPWANETYNLLEEIFPKSFHILGNHDELINLNNHPENIPEYWEVIQLNKKNLSRHALKWLSELKSEKILEIDCLTFKIYHGTPDNSLLGRFYPDDYNNYSWLPNQNEVLLMGHTHYPLVRKYESGGIIINPGSIGQPRDGNLKSSLCIFNTSNLVEKFYRIPYSIDIAIKELIEINWYPRSVFALKKSL
jgi:putative phosphoesterase